MRDIVFSLIYNFNTRLSLLVVSIFSVKLMTVAEYGELSYILTLITTLALFSLFGGGVAVNRSFSKERENKVFLVSNKIFQFNIIISLIISVIILMGILVFQKNIVQIFLIFLIFLLMSFNSIIEGSLYGLGEYKKLAINSSLVFLSSIIFSYFLILEFKAIGALVSVLLYRFILFCFNSYTLFKKKVIQYVAYNNLFKDSIVLDSFKNISLPAFFSAILVAPVMIILLKFIKKLPNGVHEIAYFSWVNQIYTIAVFFPSVLTGFLISKMSSDIKSSHGKLIQYSKYNFLFGILLASVFFVFKPFILGWAGSDYIEKSNIAYNIMLITICLYCLNAAFGSYWTSINKAYLGFYINFIWAFVVVFLGYFLVDKIKNSNAIFISLSIGYLFIFLIQISVFLLMKRVKYV